MTNTKYIPIIGLEVHVELKTKSKMFCGCSADYFGKQPNTHVCPVCLGLPGALPVPNRTAIEWCIKIAMSLNCQIPLFSKFDRKNYFYPDLPKGYQISQYDLPFGEKGWIQLKNKKIRVRRVHMEEDTAKLVHQFGISNDQFSISNEKQSFIDFNRSGIPLVEIVTEPDFHSATDVKEYLQKLQQIVRYLDVSNADMEKGDMRLEPNISLQKPGENDLPKYKVEVKNINSFRFVEKAINFEIKRQTEILENGETPLQETRGWHEAKQKTFSQRVKEEANDYRYFPEPDIPPFRWKQKYIDDIKKSLPELPDKKLNRFISEYNLSEYDAEILTREKELADYFEEAIRVNQELKNKNQESTNEKTIANWIINKKISPNETLPATLIKQILVSTKVTSIDEKELEKIIETVLANNAKAVSDFKNGKENVIMFLVGQVMRKCKQKIDAMMVKERIEKSLKAL